MTSPDDHPEEPPRAGWSSRGASIISTTAEDPLFRKLMMWSWGIFGTIFMGMQVWLVSSVADIKAVLPRLSDKDAQIDQHLSGTDRRVDRLEDKADYLSSKINQYEGRTLRGERAKDGGADGQ